MASPSYDVFCYISIAAFGTNFLELAQIRELKELSNKKVAYTLFTVLLILLSKKNYIFVLPIFLFLPMFTNTLKNRYNNISKITKTILLVITFLIIFALLILLNRYLNIRLFIKTFLNNYFNMATMGRRGKTLFSIVPTILPDLFNIIWIISLVIVALGEQARNWNNTIICGGIVVFLLNWIGIYAGFYTSCGMGTVPFDELSGRYLHPFLLFLVPGLQKISADNHMKINEESIVKIVTVTTSIIMIAYLVVCYYRGYHLHITATWVNE